MIYFAEKIIGLLRNKSEWQRYSQKSIGMYSSMVLLKILYLCLEISEIQTLTGRQQLYLAGNFKPSRILNQTPLT